jgi:hypothetical protein
MPGRIEERRPPTGGETGSQDTIVGCRADQKDGRRAHRLGSRFRTLITTHGRFARA